MRSGGGGGEGNVNKCGCTIGIHKCRTDKKKMINCMNCDFSFELFSCAMHFPDTKTHDIDYNAVK